MATDFASLTTTANQKPPTVIIYGSDGMGKTRFASEWPSPFYLPTQGEEPPTDVAMATPGYAESYQDVRDAFEFLLTQEHDFKTFVIDSLDGLETLVWEQTCADNGWNGIEDADYGKGYIAADSTWHGFIKGTEALRSAGIAVVLIAHSQTVRAEDPTSGTYDRFTLKLHKRGNALLREAATVVGFISQRKSMKIEDLGFNKKVTHAEGGGERMIHLDERPGFFAKSRYPHPASMPYKLGQGYDEFARAFPSNGGAAQT